MNTIGNRIRDPGAREARAVRILDAARELLVRHGYRRITIDDIAGRAGIGKGTVYLHWKTREDLFRAVFEREAVEAIDELIQALRLDPNGWMLHRMARSYFLIIMGRPLLTAVFLDDAELLGKLSRPDSEAGQHRDQLTARAYFELLAEHGLLQADLRPEAAAYGFLATLEGFVRAEATADEQLGSIQERAELLARIVRRAFEADRDVSPETGEAVVAQVVELFNRAADAGRADLGLGNHTGAG
jgi:AcrR family transcriptional regulator